MVVRWVGVWQASVNSKVETVEELKGRRKTLHLGMLKLAQEDLALDDPRACVVVSTAAGGLLQRVLCGVVLTCIAQELQCEPLLLHTRAVVARLCAAHPDCGVLCAEVLGAVTVAQVRLV